MTENPAIERSPGGNVPGAGSERLFSLDLLRGLDVFWLVIVQPLLAAANKTWTLPEWLRAQLVHNWGVFGLFDFAQPLFIFICGAAVPLAIPKRLTPEGRPTREFWRHVLWRVALLWTCGMLIRGILLFDRTKFTPYSDTLQTIAAGYFFACLAMLIRSRCVRVALPFVLIATYSALCVMFGDWTRLGNFPRIVDERVFGFFGFKAKDFTYCLTTIAWAGIAMLGSLAAELLKGTLPKWRKAGFLFCFSVASLVFGYALETVVPPIRHIYSPSFVAITMGYSVLSLALCYVLSDIFMVRRRMGLFLLFGQTALAAWMLHSFFWHGVAGVADRIIPGLPVLLGTNHYQGFARIVVASLLIIWLLHLWRRLRNNAARNHARCSIAVAAALLCAGANGGTANGSVRLAPPFGDGMVFQRGMPVAVWGTASAGEEVTVSFAGSTVKTVTEKTGAWKCRLPPMEASSESRTLVAAGRNGSHAVQDVLVGEVWLVGGQSNAECPFWQEKGPRYRDLKGGMMAQFYRMPLVRFTDRPGVWRECTPSNLVDLVLDATRRSTSFSAVGVYFAAQLYQAIGTPVGMIGEYVRGSGIDTWIPKEGYRAQGTLGDMLEWKRIPAKEWTKDCISYPIVRHGEQPSLYWESRMARWTPYTFRGVLWIQGSSNKEDPRYCEKLHALYSGWARLFENPGMSFYLAETGHGDGTCFNLQLQQARFVAEEPNAALAPANDVGNPRDAHGNDKEMIARRLLLHALRRNYGFTDVRSEPPVVKSARASGELAVLAIEHVRTLYVYNADFSLKTCFELAGDDGIWHPAEIVNFTRTAWSMDGYIASPEIVLKAKGVNKPSRARYLHGKSSPSNVYGDTCLPLLAFETLLAR